MNDFIAMQAERRVRCELIAARLRRDCFDVTWDRVNRNYQWFVRWDEGRIALGYLIRRTGIRRKQQERTP